MLFGIGVNTSWIMSLDISKEFSSDAPTSIRLQSALNCSRVLLVIKQTPLPGVQSMLPLACPLLTVHYCNPLWFLKEKLTTTSNWFGYCSKFIGHQCYMAWKMHVLRLRHEAQLKCLTESRLWLCWIRVEKSAQEILSKTKTKTARIKKNTA